MSPETPTVKPEADATLSGQPKSAIRPALIGQVLAVTILYYIIYSRAFSGLYGNWTLVDSYYSHGFLIPPLSIYLAWLRRKELAEATIQPSPWGYPFVLAAIMFLLVGAFLGFGVFEQFSLLPMLIGLVFLIFGKEHVKILWFPLVLLIFMIPIPSSITQSIALKLKLVAAEGAVFLSRTVTLPMVRQGSYIHFKGDYLLVGEVCGGLRSLISLLALGVLMAYFSKAKMWAKWLVVLLSGPIAVISNVLRIFLVCVVGYFWGSTFAAGTFHDVSGVVIFAVAFVLFFSLEALLRRMATEDQNEEKS